MESFMKIEARKTSKRVLECDGDVMGGLFHENRKEKKDRAKIGQDDLFDEKHDKKKRKKIRDKSDNGYDLKTISNKRREEKERKAYLNELHAESQRVLRETRGVSFKPTPIVKIPISSVLEKIRKRKLEISKKYMIVNDTSHGSEGNIRPRDRLMDLDISNEERAVESVPITVEKEMVAPSLDGRTYLAVSNMDKDAAELTIHGNDPNRASANEEPIPAFPAPVDDTQDLFDDSEPNGPTAIENEPQLNGPLEEEFAPSLLAMNAKFDSAPVADISSEEEDDEKEKIGPHPCGIADDSSSPRRGPVKIFVDDEAEDEDDSDTEAADCIDDLMELKDMIAPECEERHIDKERRDELHRKWLEQQDAAETEYLLQRLKCGSGLGDAFRSYNKLETDEDGEELNDESEEESLPQKSGRVAKSGKVNIEKAKQIILQLFSDKEDIYLSDDDGTQRRHAQCLIRKEEQATLLSPTDDVSSREVFGLIKKVNVASDNKRKPKSWSIFDTVLKRGNDDHPAKSSFLGRVPNHPLPSSHKKGSATVQSFIFQRKNSNSRSSMSISEDFSDTVSRDTRLTRNLTAKYSNSETKVRSQTRDAAPETLSKTSLLEILKRPSSQSQVCNKDTSIDLRKSLFASGVSTMPTKRNGRS